MKYNKARILNLPIRETPSFRVTNNAQSCNLSELLAAVIGGNYQLEVAERLVARFGDVRNLDHALLCEIAAVDGIGISLAARLKAALALGRRLIEPETAKSSMHSPQDIADLIAPILINQLQEIFLVIPLNTRNNVIDVIELYKGTLNSANIRVAEVMRVTIQHNASALILAHNHPSGDPTPSTEDITMTRAIKSASTLMDIDFLDHIVWSNSYYRSLKEMAVI